MGAMLARLIGGDARGRFGTGLSALGLLFLGYALGVYFELLPGSQVIVPDPPALSRTQTRPTASTSRARATPTLVASVVRPMLASVPVTAAGTVAPGAPPTRAATTTVAAFTSLTAAPQSSAPTPEAPPTSAATPTSYVYDPDTAGSEERLALSHIAKPGPPVLLRIAKIGLETKVTEAGIGTDKRGRPTWETVPFVAAHYNVTAPVGARGNAVISGHVVTVYEGNVFRNLYKVEFGDRIEVSTLEATFVYEITDIKLVEPTEVGVMEQTPDATLTLITCGGRFDRRTTSFDKRLVVVGKLVSS